MKRMLIIIFISMLLIKAFANQEQNIYKGPYKKDPILAGSLSLYIPGLGQFYAGKPGKGLAFFVTEASITLTGLRLVTDYSYGLANGVIMTKKAEVSDHDKTIAWSMLALLVGIHPLAIRIASAC